MLPHRPSLDTALLYRDVFICIRLWRIMEGVSKRPPVVSQYQSLVLTIKSASRYVAEVLLLLTIIIASLIHSLRVLNAELGQPVKRREMAPAILRTPSGTTALLYGRRLNVEPPSGYIIKLATGEISDAYK